MALTKLPKAGLGTGSVSSDQIEDGTIQNQEFEDGTLTSAKLADSTIANAKLSNSSFTLNGNSISLGASGTFVDGELVEWQTVKTADFTAVAGQGYFVNTTSTAITVTLPASASLGDTIAIKDYAGTFATNNCTIGRNGHNIQGAAGNSLLSTNRASVVLVYADATKGWLFTDEHNVADLQLNTYVTATGGTETTTGDYKIHTFTSSSNFVVSCAGSSQPHSGKVDYLVIAGGGGGGSDAGGGGGAGGYRESAGTDTGSYSVSPLGSGVSSITVTAQTYPITVGAGGGSNSKGSDSTFSTITSAGGGTGNGPGPAISGGLRNGGSGGGGRYTSPNGNGNTPPVSPPQGNPGGNSIPPAGAFGGGGGGGATASGSTTTPSSTGNGGAGATSNINGTGTTRAGGGGGGGGNPSGYTVGGSGVNGGAPGRNYNDAIPGPSATANTGGGGGAGADGAGPKDGGNGGSGIVILRYKYQN